jgi:hypothetical protein
MSISKSLLKKQYLIERKSSATIAKLHSLSESGVNYWLKKYGIAKRDIAEAMYAKHNPKGDPFAIRTPQTLAQAQLRGLGLGLYWGEGTKKSKTSIKLGNSDPALINAFIKFLKEIYGIKTDRLRFSLQVFSDCTPEKALTYWRSHLHVARNRSSKTTITKSGRIGTYRQKNLFGVATVYFHNRKLRDILCSDLKTMPE